MSTLDASVPTIHPAAPPARVLAVRPAAPPMAARHFLGRLAFETDPSDLAADLAAGVPRIVVVDARTPDAYRAEHIPGAVNLPHATIDELTTADLDPDSLYVTYCIGPGCNAATKGAAALAGLGFRTKELIGGIAAWTDEGFPTEGTRRGASEAALDGATTCRAC